MKSEYQFEIHLTIKCDSDYHFKTFTKACESINAKAIAIDLKNSKQIMSSKTIKCSFNDLINIVNNDEITLNNMGFEVIRKKIETVRSFVEESFFSCKYYEIHVPCIEEEIVNFNLDTLDKKWHRSKNSFKDGIIMLTCREEYVKPLVDDTIKQIDLDIERLKTLNLIHDSFNKKYEYAIHDTNINLDTGWID